MSTVTLLRLEWRRLLANKPLLLTVFGGLLLYAFLYPQPYLKQTPHNQAIAVINSDGSSLSRELVRMVDASPLLSVHARVSSIEQAQQMLIERQVGGLLVIPENFYRDLVTGRSPTLSYAGDASYFLVYGTIVEGLATISATLAAKVKVAHMVIDGTPLEAAAQIHSPIALSSQAVFNAHQGYLDYVIPAVFMVILHQTLIIAIGLHAAKPIGGLRPDYRRHVQPWQLVIVRLILFVGLYLLMSAFYLGFVMNSYGVHHWAKVTDILMLLVPFLVATSAVSMCIAEFLPRRDYATIVGVMTSLPIVFCCGFIWPLSSIPVSVNIIADFIPAKPMVLAMLKLNQMGASLQEIQHHLLHLWALVILYLMMITALLRYRQSRLSCYKTTPDIA